MNLTLVVCPLAYIISTDGKGHDSEEDRYIDPFQIETFVFPDVSGVNRELLVKFGKRRNNSEIIEYEGTIVDNGIPPGVWVSCDILTVSAKRVRLIKGSFLLVADGDVSIEDGNQCLKFNHIEVNLKAEVFKDSLLAR
jgi:hypothetical protein